MNRKTVEEIVRSILIEQFHVKTEYFLWDKPLVTLSEKFRILGFLVELELLLQARLNSKFQIIETIDTAYHSPQDLVNYVMEEFQ